MQLLKEVPLYNDVMLPSTSDKLALPPSKRLHTPSTAEGSKAKHYTPAPSSSSSTGSSVVRRSRERP